MDVLLDTTTASLSAMLPARVMPLSQLQLTVDGIVAMWEGTPVNGPDLCTAP